VIVDAGAAQPLSEAELRTWASEQRVFISSAMDGMTAERSSVADAIQNIGATPVWFEEFGGRDDDPERAYISEVVGSDIYIGILGPRYGRVLPSGYSPTQEEYDEAVRRGLRIGVWASQEDLHGRQRDFLDEIRVFRTTGSYGSPDALAAGVTARLGVIAAEAVSPWVKVGDVIFRARRVHHSGTELVVDARIRDDHAVASLEALRPGGFWGSNHDTRVTWSGRTENVRIRSVATETSAGRGCDVHIVAETVAVTNFRPMIDVALSDRSPEDLTELAVRVALFGAENPLGMMSFMISMDNPFRVIESLGLTEDAVEPVAHVLMTEELVGGGRAQRITALQVGPNNHGQRRVQLAWLPRRRYTNVTPGERRVSGAVRVG
jgi:hypothetical protein